MPFLKTVLTPRLSFFLRELHCVNSDISIQETHGLLHYSGVHPLYISGHAQLDRVLDEA